MSKLILILFAFFSSITSFAAPNIFIYHGNKVTNDQQFPFVVAIYDESRADELCTGSLIGDRWVLTAYHCVNDGAKPENRFVGIGYQSGKYSSSEKIFSVKKIFIYPQSPNNNDYNPYWWLKYDFALLQLDEPTGIKPVELPADSQEFPDLKSGKQKAISVGYGWTDISWPADCEQDPNSYKCIPDMHWEADLKFGEELIQSDQSTQDLLQKYVKLEEIPATDPFPAYNSQTMLGLISPDGKRPTSGDSGGPLLIQIKQPDGLYKYVQVGVTSWGLPYSYIAYTQGYLEKEPGVDVNITNPKIINFIKKTMLENS